VNANLTDEEIDSMCQGLRQNAAKVGFLRALGLHVDVKPNGRPLVSRAHHDAVRGAAARQPLQSPVGRWTR
jgi:hypothetical protein